jgi:hypothetical protein
MVKKRPCPIGAFYGQEGGEFARLVRASGARRFIQFVWVENFKLVFFEPLFIFKFQFLTLKLEMLFLK